MKKNEGGQVIAFQAVSSTDGSAVTTGSPTVYVTIDGGTQATGANTAIHEGQGAWSYVPTQAETDGDHVVYTFTLAGCINQSVNVYPVVVTEYQATGFSTFDHTTDAVTTDAASRTASQADVSALATQASIDTVDANVDSILTDTGELQTKIIPMVEADGVGGYQYTALSLENAPSGGGGGGDATAANQTSIITSLNEIRGTTFDSATDSLEAIKDNQFDAANDTVANVTTVATCTTNADMVAAPDNASIAAILVDTAELQSKLIPMLESDGAAGFQFTTLSLENAPSGGGGGGDATLANQTSILTSLTEIRGAAFDSATDSLEAIKDNQFDAANDTVANVATVATCTTNADMRGTDGANTATPDNISIAAILADTTELQLNQGDWATATGFSTFNPAVDAVASVTNVTNNVSASVVDLSTNALNQLITENTGVYTVSAGSVFGTLTNNVISDVVTELGNLNDLDSTQVQTAAMSALNTYDPPTNAEMVARTLPNTQYATESAVTAMDLNVDAILLDTNELQQNQGNWNTATGFSTFNPLTDTVANVAVVQTCTTNADMRGTDNANTVAPDNISIAAILADTTELQLNQGDWTTANVAGLSTFDPTVDTVANVANVAACATNADMRGTDGANTVSPDNASIAAILVDTSDLQASQGDWVTADLSGLTSQVTTIDGVVNEILVDTNEVQEKFTSMVEADGPVQRFTANALELGPNDKSDATLAQQNAILASLADAKGVGFDGATDSLEAIRDRGDGFWSTSQSGSGGGIHQITVTVLDTTAEANPVQGARVGIDGTDLVATTGTNGQAVLNVNNGVYTINVSAPSGFTDPAAQSVSISGSDANLSFSADGSYCEIPPL